MRDMMTRHLYLAYAATWLIHISYVLYLTFKARKLAREIEELKK